MAFLTVETFDKEKNRHDLTHWHNRIEVIRVLKDTMSCVVNGSEFPLEQDDVLIINRQQLHRILCPKGSSAAFQQLMIDQSLFTADRLIYQKYVVPVLSDESFQQVLLKSGNNISTEMLNVFDEVADLERLMPAAYEMRVIALMYMLFQRLFQHYAEQRGDAGGGINQDILLYRRVTDFIYRNYMEKLSLDDIASAGNISRSKCCSLFKEYAGRSPVDFLNLYRLRQSTELLKNSSENIASIAADCGFGQQSYFNRLFLREYGMTPREYRNS